MLSDLKSPTRTFILRYTLYVSNICKNLIFVHHFTSQNNVFLKLHPFYFLYESSFSHFPNSLVGSTSKFVANLHELTSLDEWHKHLDHPYFIIVKNLVNHFSLPITHNKMNSLCSLCSINKTHQLPFRPPVFRVRLPLILLILMCGDLLIVLV